MNKVPPQHKRTTPLAKQHRKFYISFTPTLLPNGEYFHETAQKAASNIPTNLRAMNI
jgi:hypothetical protein